MGYNRQKRKNEEIIISYCDYYGILDMRKCTTR